MSSLTYETIEPLLEKDEVRSGTLYCTFRCPVSDIRVESSHTIQHRSQAEEANLLLLPGRPQESGQEKQERRNILHAMLNWLPRSETKIGEPVSGAPTDPLYSPEERQRAILGAFRQVRGRFAWDGNKNRWVAIPAENEEEDPQNSTSEVLPPSTTSRAADFVAQVQRAPVREARDREVLARMLTEVARADARMEDDEWAFLCEFISAEPEGRGKSFSSTPLTEAELRQTTPGPVRETLLMLAWGLALTDEELAASEASHLEHLANALEITPDRADELRRYAQWFLLEAALEEVWEREEAEGNTDTGAIRDQLAREIPALSARFFLSAEDGTRALSEFIQSREQ